VASVKSRIGVTSTQPFSSSRALHEIVRPFVRGSKNYATDAQAIFEAAVGRRRRLAPAPSPPISAARHSFGAICPVNRSSTQFVKSH
jgi:transposase